MTTVTFACPECQTNLKTSQRIGADQEVRCPKCGTVFPAPPETSFSAPDDSRIEATSDFDESGSSEAFQNRSRSNRTKKILLASALIVALFTAGTAYFVWHTIENWGRNTGTGREDPLAFVPAESTLVMGVDMGALADHPAWAALIEKGIRDLNRTPIFWDDCKTNTGVEFRDLFDHIILAFKLDGLNPSEPPHLTLIAHSRLPFNQNRVRDSEKDMYRQVAEGKTYYERNDGNIMDLTRLYMPSDRILILSNLPQYDFETLLEKDRTEPLQTPDEVQRIRGLQENPFWAAFPFNGPTRQNLSRTTPILAKMLPDLAPILETFSHAKGAGALARWEEDKMALSLSLECDTEAAATKGSTRLQEYWDKHVKGWKLSKELQGLTRELVDHAKFSADGANIHLTARITPPQPDDLFPLGIQVSRIFGFGQIRPAAPENPRGFPPPGLRKGPRGFGPGGPNQPPPGKV